jgi:hypothetical protein
MTLSEAILELLKLLEQTDEEEYDSNQASVHILQACYEIADEMEVPHYNVFSQFEINDDYIDQDYWTTVPGRVPIVTSLGTTLSEYSHIKKIWLDSGGETQTFTGTELVSLLNEYGDTTGQPKKYAVEGQYLYYRPFINDGTATYTMRILWASLPVTAGTDTDSPIMLQIAPYAVLYRAAVIASMWLLDDDRASRFEKLGQRAVTLLAPRLTMQNDTEDTTPEEYNG